jgi:pimeloyl-ACP methyl ester carboxylesterase
MKPSGSLPLPWHIEQAGTGEPIILLHHGLGCTRDWDGIAPRLAERHRVIAYDRPGYGRSAITAPRHTLREDAFERDAEQLIALLDQLEIDAAHIVGHSDGGTIGLIAAARWPERVRSLVVEAAHIYFEEIGLASVRRALEWGTNQPAGQEYMRSRHGEYGPQVLQMFAEHWLKYTPPSWTLLPLLPAIRCSTLVIQGTNDNYGSEQQPRDIAAAIPAAALWLLDGVGHDPHIEQAEAYISRVLAFLDAQAADVPTPRAAG